MKSPKQRRKEIKDRRRAREERRLAEARKKYPSPPPPGSAPVQVENLAPCNSYGVPKFVERGYYEDVPFTCVGCGVEEIWTATQQKWWYEVAKGFVYSSANRCRACRRRERERRAEARRVHLEGIARKQREKTTEDSMRRRNAV